MTVPKIGDFKNVLIRITTDNNKYQVYLKNVPVMVTRHDLLLMCKRVVEEKFRDDSAYIFYKYYTGEHCKKYLNDKVDINMEYDDFLEYIKDKSQ